MTERAKPTAEELARRVEGLEEALDRMLGAFREELATLRDDLRRMDGVPAVAAGADAAAPRPRPARTASAEASTIKVDPSLKSEKRTVSEEHALWGTKKDPRSDD